MGRNQAPKAPPFEIENYEKHLGAHIAYEEVKLNMQKMFPDVYHNTTSMSYIVVMYGRLEHGRGGPTMRTICGRLQDAGILDSWERKEEYPQYHGPSLRMPKPDIRWHLYVSKQWYKNWVVGKGEMPEFVLKSTVRVIKNGVSHNRDAKDLDNYRSISHDTYGGLGDEGLLYLRNHPDEFLYEVREASGYSDKTVVCYPKELRQDLSAKVFRQYLEKYVSEHFEICVELVLDINENVINKTSYVSGNPGAFLKADDWTEKELSRKIRDCQEGIAIMERSLPVLLQIQKKLNERGYEDLFKETADKFHEHMEESYPLYLNSDDKALKQLAEWMVQGKHAGQLVA